MLTSTADWLPAGDDLAANSAQRQLQAIRTSARSRAYAGLRLQRQGRVWLATLVALSLGLILIPLLQNASVRLAVAPNVINLVHIFLGVSVLVCVVLVGSANHALRARALLECSDRLRELAREFEKVCEDVGAAVMSSHILDEFRQRHADMVRNLEAPTRNDQRQALLALAEDHRLGITERVQMSLQSATHMLAGLAMPVAIVLVEIVLVANVLGASQAVGNYLSGRTEAAQQEESGEMKPALQLGR